MNRLIVLFSCLVVFLMAVHVKGESTNDISPLLELAQAGNAGAQIGLGVMYAQGVGVAEDDREAVKWFRLAAEQGEAKAQYYLGFMYREGEGVAKDAREAVKWYRLAAEQGFAEAQFNLGLMYRFGEDVAKDASEAAKWFRLAAEQGDAKAQFNLGVMYANGEGVAEDAREAMKCYRLAAEQGVAEAQVFLGAMYDNGVWVAKDDREAAKWYRLAAEQGNALAQCMLGARYANGVGVLQDYVEAYAWSLLALMNGESDASRLRDLLGSILTGAQISQGQARAKEILSQMERKKTIVESDSNHPLSSDIAPSGFGSGFLIKGGYVLTCWHVVDGAERIAISLNGKDHVARLVQKDSANDIAILKVDDALEGAALAFSDGVKLGEKVFTLGYPHPDLQGSDVKFTTGSISGMTGPENTPRYFQISAPLQSGNSGGPLFDEKGNLVGIVAAKLDSVATLALTGDLPQNVNYAIKADYLLPLLKTVAGLEIGKETTKDVNLLELIEELKKTAVMIKVY